MMNAKLIAVLCLGLNVLLAAWVLNQSSKSRDQPDWPDPASAPAPDASSLPPAKSSGARTNFHWSQVESRDYLVYIANLRAIGCPEETLRDIIVADVNKLYAPRYAALTATAPELAWWGRYDRRKPLPPALAAALRALDGEKKSLLLRLLGAGAATEFAFVETSAASLREENSFAFLPEARRAAVRELLNRYQAVRQWSEGQWKGLPSDERDRREKELLDARAKELAALLTPEELREFALRDSLAADDLRQQFGRGDLSEAEFRKLFDLQEEFQRNHPAPDREDMKRLDAYFGEALGLERLADLQRQNDRTWRGLVEIATDHDLSPEALGQAYDIKREYLDKMVQAVGAMFADPQQNPQPVRDIAAEMDRRLEPFIGAAGIKHLDRINALPRLVVETDGKGVSYSFSRGNAPD